MQSLKSDNSKHPLPPHAQTFCASVWNHDELDMSRRLVLDDARHLVLPVGPALDLRGRLHPAGVVGSRLAVAGPLDGLQPDALREVAAEEGRVDAIMLPFPLRILNSSRTGLAAMSVPSRLVK